MHSMPWLGTCPLSETWFPFKTSQSAMLSSLEVPHPKFACIKHVLTFFWWNDRCFSLRPLRYFVDFIFLFLWMPNFIFGPFLLANFGKQMLILFAGFIFFLMKNLFVQKEVFPILLKPGLLLTFSPRFHLFCILAEHHCEGWYDSCWKWNQLSKHDHITIVQLSGRSDFFLKLWFWTESLLFVFYGLFRFHAKKRTWCLDRKNRSPFFSFSFFFDCQLDSPFRHHNFFEDSNLCNQERRAFWKYYRFQQPGYFRTANH